MVHDCGFVESCEFSPDQLGGSCKIGKLDCLQRSSRSSDEAECLNVLWRYNKVWVEASYLCEKVGQKWQGVNIDPILGKRKWFHETVKPQGVFLTEIHLHACGCAIVIGHDNSNQWRNDSSHAATFTNTTHIQIAITHSFRPVIAF